MGYNSVVGRPKERVTLEPLGYDQMRDAPGIKDTSLMIMKCQRRLGSLCFSDLSGFRRSTFQALGIVNRLAPSVPIHDWHLVYWVLYAGNRRSSAMLVPIGICRPPWLSQASFPPVSTRCRF